jgi:hypothetical protein
VKIVTIDVTDRCPLRCTHCYMPERRMADLDASTFASELRRLCDARQPTSAFWVGGEPLLRADVVRVGTALFARNAIATSGVVPIPPVDARVLVSLDGLRPEHDALRGSRAFDRALGHLSSLPARSFAISMLARTRRGLHLPRRSACAGRSPSKKSAMHVRRERRLQKLRLWHHRAASRDAPGRRSLSGDLAVALPEKRSCPA